MAIQFEDYSIEVKGALNDSVIAFLYEAGQLIEGKVVDDTPVDTGQLQGSWKYEVDEGEGKVVIGSPLENSIWNEFGTGQYALHGDGRKTPWFYEDAKGEGHWTHGKRPQRTFFNVFNRLKLKIQKELKKRLKEGMK